MAQKHQFDEPGGVALDDIPTDSTGGVSHDKAIAKTAKIEQRLLRLQELLYAADRHSVLIVLQGLDTAGKDGTISHVMAQVNPSGCQVHNFKVPTEEELRHDFLWRVHQRTPARGAIAIWNRSHYEDVLVARVHDLVPHHVWEARYEEINHFEHLLAESGAIILKFMLHISKQEQKERLEARMDDPTKQWKLSAGDWHEREFWRDYQRAYEAVLSRCSTKWAPWHVIPADKKWYRNYAVASAIVDRLSAYEKEWEAAVLARGKTALAEAQAAREAHANV